MSSGCKGLIDIASGCEQQSNTQWLVQWLFPPTQLAIHGLAVLSDFVCAILHAFSTLCKRSLYSASRLVMDCRSLSINLLHVKSPVQYRACSACQTYIYI